MAHHLTLIPGDGIGPEVIGAARRVLEATGVELDWDVQQIGAAAVERCGEPLPQFAIDSIRERGCALKGPVSTPAGAGFRSVNIALREALDLYAGVRPCRSLAGAPAPIGNLDTVIVRMTGEDLYAGIELEAGTDAASRLRTLVRETHGVDVGSEAGISLKPISAAAAKRAARFAFEYAATNDRPRVTIVHKATVMRETDGLFLEAARDVAGDYPGIEVDDALVDDACRRLVQRPASCDVLLTTVMYGDILSDLAAALVGGPGVAPGANFGDRCAVFEAAHGTAPRHAGRGRANPMAMMLTGAMLLEHLGEDEAASRVKRAVAAVSATGPVTYDLAGQEDGARPPATASEVTSAIVEALEAGDRTLAPSSS